MQQQAFEAKRVIVRLFVKWDFFFNVLFLTLHPSQRLSCNKLPNHFKTTHIKYWLQTLFGDIMLIKMKCIVAVSK